MKRIILESFICLMFICVVSCTTVEPEEEIVLPETIGSWTKLNQGIALPGIEDMYCFDRGDSIFALFQDGGLFSFTIETLEQQKEKKLPLTAWNTGVRYTAVSSGTTTYVVSSLDNKLYSLRNNQWTEVCEMGFRHDSFGGYYHGYISDNTIYLLSSSYSVAYDLNTGVWTDKSSSPEYWEDENHMNHVVYGGYSMNGLTYKGKVYIVKSEGDIFEYDPAIDKWTHLAKYPGVILDEIVCFAAGNSLCFGMGHIDHSPSYMEKWLENELWSLDLATLNWEEQEKIPFELEHGKLFYFYKNERLYLGHAPLTKYYNLYTYTP